MSKMNIRGSEYQIKKIFSDDFVFTIPLYQRAYSWTTEQSEELYQDLWRAMEGGEKPIEELPPYFLGSIVLIKDDEPDAQVIDGQQRLTTLTMLLAAIRSFAKSDYAEGLTSLLSEKGNVITGTPTRYRLRLRDRDAQYFQKYIQDEGGIEELKALQDSQLSEPQRNIRANMLGFLRELEKLSQNQLTALTQFIVNRCFLIVVAVSSPDLDSVYRIFSVLNSRGLNLSYPDMIKSEIISAIQQSQQDEYANRWEELEAMLGTEAFEDLFFHLRAIFAKKRQVKGMIEEFHQYVTPHYETPQDFIEKTLSPYAHAFNNILKVATYDHQTVTIEHVLPQRPSPDSEWSAMFPSKDIRQRYVHRLGNLVLLSKGKNMKAENFDFDDKKQKYFTTNGGVSPFVITTQVLRYREWTPATIEQRQSQLISTLKQLWRL